LHFIDKNRLDVRRQGRVIPCRDQAPGVWAADKKRLDVPAPPNVIDHEQDAPMPQRRCKLLTRHLEIDAFASFPGKPANQACDLGKQIRLFPTDRHPYDSVLERILDIGIVQQGRREHRFPVAAATFESCDPDILVAGSMS
jgi:hypothetical protein